MWGRMRLALLLALVAVARADETRAWRGVITVRASGRLASGSRGSDEQTERVELLLVSQRPAEDQKNPPTRLAMRNGKGGYTLRVDVEGRHVATKGNSAGILHPTVSGLIDPTTGRYHLRVRVTPTRIVTLVTLSGMHAGGFRTWRTSIERGSFLGAFRAEGKLEGRVMSGRRKFIDRNAKLTRDVVIEWRFERIDPELRGRVVDHLGRPVAGVAVHARTTDPARVKKKLPPHFRGGETDRHGHFTINAFWSVWGVRLIPFVRDGVLYARPDVEAFHLRFDKAPKKELVMDAYELAALPDAHLLERHFQGNAGAYLDHVRSRATKQRLKQALLRPR